MAIKVLFIAQCKLSREMGGSKVVLELAAALNRLGVYTKVVSTYDIEDELRSYGFFVGKDNCDNIKNYLLSWGNDYDIVDIDANLFYKKIKDSRITKPKFFVRSVLFIPHLDSIKIPYKRSFRTYLGNLYRLCTSRGITTSIRIKRFISSLFQADYIFLSSSEDLRFIKKFPELSRKAYYLPYGIDKERRESLQCTILKNSKRQKVLFLGTFDYRKGCLEIPKVFSYIKQRIPNAELLLLGCKGQFQTKQKILTFFDTKLHNSIQVIPTFSSADISNYISDCKVAIFPSYLEGCPFSVLECMAAGIPVVAYKSPGASDLLPSDSLVEPSDWCGMAEKVLALFYDESIYLKSMKVQVERSELFDWDVIAERTFDHYKNLL